MSAFVRFEPGELAWEDYNSDDGTGWTVMRSPWIVPVPCIGPIDYARTEAGGRTGYLMDITSSGPAHAGMRYVWLGTKDALWNRLNGLGPVGLDAARLSVVLQRLLVELDAEQAKGAEPTGLAEADPQGDAIATLTTTEIQYLAGRWGYIDGDAVAVRRRLAGMTFAECAREVLEAKRRVEAYGMDLSLEESIEAGLVVLERDGLYTHLTWIRGPFERTADLDPRYRGDPWTDIVTGRVVWPRLDRAAVQHNEPEVWTAAVEAWSLRPAWPAEQAGEATA